MNFEPSEKGVPIRQPATANLVIDSADRNESKQPNPFDFQITRPNSLLNGFFTRIGTTEVVLEWNQPNGSTLADKGDMQVFVSTTGGSFTSSIVNNNAFPDAFYTTASALDNLVAQLNIQFSPATFSVSTIASAPVIASPDVQFAISTCAYSKALGLESVSSFSTTTVAPYTNIVSPDLRPFRYIDFTSAQLTYNQDLKDSSSAELVRDVLCRWYFDWDNQPQRDVYGFPIEMGYEPFKLRRLFNPPKQIKWDSRQPVGNLAFQVYGNSDYSPINPVKTSLNSSEWLMTLQVSET